MEYIIRYIEKAEYPLLKDFLYNAIFVPEGAVPPPKSILASDDLQVYVKGFGDSKDDKGLVAEVNGNVVGAVWVRIMNDYGHIDDQTPSCAISLYKEYRGLGIGSELMKAMLILLKDSGYERVSLAVQKDNYALKLYQSVGFKIVDENAEEYIMVNDLRQQLFERNTYYGVTKS